MSIVEKIIKEAATKQDIAAIDVSKLVVKANKDLQQSVHGYSKELIEKFLPKIPRLLKKYKSLTYYTIGHGDEVRLQGGEYYYNHFFIIDKKTLTPEMAITYGALTPFGKYATVVGIVVDGKLYGYNDVTNPASKVKKAYVEMNKAIAKYAKMMSHPRFKAKTDLINSIKIDFKSFNPGGYNSNRDIEVDGMRISKDYRSLGKWINDYEDGQNEYEDNDQRIWAPGEYKKYQKMFIEWAKKYPWYKKVELDLDTSEKDWCYFTIKVK